MLHVPSSRPARTYEEALERVRVMGMLDDDTVRPQAYTRLYSHDRATPLSIVLWHGITNNPQQYDLLAPQLHARGHNVLVPRLPGHGDRDRMTTRLKSLTAEGLLAAATEAVDIAQGLGEQVVLAGISTSGLLCAYFAQYRRDVAHCVPINPVFSMLSLSRGVNDLVEKVLLLLPNFYFWWNPRIKEAQLPLHGYPRVPTHALMQCLRIGDDIYNRAQADPPLCGAVTFVTNRLDPAVNNNVTYAIFRFWQRQAAERVRIFEFDDLPKNHDIIDPTDALAQVDTVYPKLVEICEQVT